MMNRRTFLTIGGGAVAGITLGEVGRRQLATINARQGTWRGPGTVTWATSVCRECPAGCGIRARLVDGVPVNLQGNRTCPVAQGRLCSRGQAALEGYFDPDRLVGPVKRAGKRGENGWEPIEWPAAIALLAQTVQHQAATPDTILALGSDEQGPAGAAWERFWKAAGARVAWTSAPTAVRLRAGFTAMTGVVNDPVFDYEDASYILSFGAPLVEDWLSPAWAQRSYGRFRESAMRARGRLVHVEGRCSMTARKADEWIAVPAERQALLAYGIAAVLMRENRGDLDFLNEVGGNVADFEREMIEWYASLDAVAAAGGVSTATLVRLARDLVTTQQPLVVVAPDAPPALVDAVMALNALIGAFDRSGGVFAPQGVPSAAPPADAATVLQEVVAGRLKPGLVAFRDAGVLRALSTPAAFSAAISEAGLIVSFSPYLDEAAAIADLVMPAHTPLENWHAVVPSTAVRAEMVALARPAVQPRLDTKDLVATLHETAASVGGAVADACADCKSTEDLVTAELTRLWDMNRGAPYSSFQETVTRLEGGSASLQPITTSEQFSAAVFEAGGWVDPYLDPGWIKESLRLQQGLKFALPGAPPAAGAASAASAADAQSDFPLHLLPFVPPTISQTGSPNQPGVLELLGPPDTAPWRVWAEMHPAVAEAAGVGEGATARITSQHGSVTVVARIVPDMPRDIVAVACVPALGNGGRWAQLVDADARRLLGPQGISAPCAVRVSRE